ncbi:MAG: alpha/beta hydrolase [Lachnospiraceae bacterium]|nr:alpha/beta hydrolase [Lachnospiraceae bacterium]
MISKPVKAILHALSYKGIEVEASRRLADIKKLDPMRILCRKLDAEIYNNGYKIPIRLYFSSEEAMEEAETAALLNPDVLLFFHGGGWVTESVENYDRVCARMAQATGRTVISVEYRLAPEHRFPVGLQDCYSAARALYTGGLNDYLPHADTERITVMGDSAGGNLAAAVCMMARDIGEFEIKQQILIYPAVNNCYTEESAFPSVRENGEDYLLTAKKMEDYLNLYQSSPRDRENPYFAPLLAKDFRNMPRTLILTAEYDPLRDEGEAYGKCLRDAGNEVEIHRLPEALHGYFALGIKFYHVQESFEHINRFLTV